MSKKWNVEEVSERFSEMVEASHVEGTQFIVNERGEEVAVLAPIGEWRRLKGMNNEDFDIKAWLLAPEARTDNLTPPRVPLKFRPPPTFD